MEVLLVRPNDQKQVYGMAREYAACETPYWAMMLAAYLRSFNHEVSILDAEVEDLSPEDVASRIHEWNPTLVGIIVTGTNLSASTWKMSAGGELAKKIKYMEGYEGKIFFWGLHPSALPEQTLREEETDFVIKGEGFRSIHSLLEAVKKNDEASYQDIKGLYWKKGNEICGNPEIDLAINLDELPMQAFDLVPMHKYRAHNWQTFGEDKSRGYAVIATSIGCPFQCSFCAVSALFGKKNVRYRSAESVVAEIDVLVKQYKVHYIKILDECFVLNRKHVERICDLLIERNYDLNIWAYARVDTVDEKLLEKLYKAGFRWLALGIESVSQDILKDVSKGQYTAKDTENTIYMIHDAGIHVIANFMFGLPEDTRESMMQTLDFAKRLNCEWPNFYTTMAYPGSKLYLDCIETKVALPDSWLGYSQYSYECMPLPTKYLKADEVLAFRDYAFRDYFEGNDRYFAMMEKEFGRECVERIKRMMTKKLKRKLLER